VYSLVICSTEELIFRYVFSDLYRNTKSSDSPMPMHTALPKANYQSLQFASSCFTHIPFSLPMQQLVFAFLVICISLKIPQDSSSSKAKSKRTITYLEKESNNKNLQTSHANHHQALNNTKIEDSPLGTPDCAEISVLAGTEVFLVARDGGELT
jgi:hypothetical protein